MNLQELTNYAGGFVEYCEDTAEVVDVLLDMGYGLPHPGARPDERATDYAVTQFEEQTGVNIKQLVGVHWALVGGRVVIADE